MTQQAFDFSDRYNSLPPVERMVALYLSEYASSNCPVALRHIQGRLSERLNIRASEREVKAIIRELRRTHGLPIMSRKGKPSGYWLCSSVEEMQEWIKAFRSQALDELATVSKIVRVNYPQLAGQLDIEFKAVA